MRSISLRGVCKVLLTLVATSCTSLVSLIAGGTPAPALPFVGAIGTIIYSAVSLHVVLLGARGRLGTQSTRHQVEAFLRRVVPPFENARD